MLHAIFDNTLSVGELAKRTILKDEPRNEVQLYNIGQKVDGYGHGFYFGIIVEVYENNGYYYYVIEYKLKQRSKKTYTKTLRQKDIKLI